MADCCCLPGQKVSPIRPRHSPARTSAIINGCDRLVFAFISPSLKCSNVEIRGPSGSGVFAASCPISGQRRTRRKNSRTSRSFTWLDAPRNNVPVRLAVGPRYPTPMVRRAWSGTFTIPEANNYLCFRFDRAIGAIVLVPIRIAHQYAIAISNDKSGRSTHQRWFDRTPLVRRLTVVGSSS